MATDQTATQRAMIGLIKVYRYGISPFLPARCRYIPSCSEYALDAVKIHGAITGGKLAAKRLCSCHSWGGHGYDPVPPKQTETK